MITIGSFLIGCGSTSDLSSNTVDSLSENEGGYYPSKAQLDYPNVLKANRNDWCQVIKNAPPQSTILLEDGEYTNYCAIRNKSYITIKAEHKYGVKYTGYDFFLKLEDKNHHINLLNIEASASIDTFDAGLLKVHGYSNFDNHHIYVADCWIHDSGSGILTSPRNHDITVDRCLFNDIKRGYGWYAMGWHLTLSNSVMYHMENDGMMVRGYFPLNRTWDYKTARDEADVRKESGLELLSKDNWTHHIIGNFFGEGYGRVAARGWDRGAAIGLYIGRDSNDGDDAYLAPQNVLIQKNYFYNITPSIAKSGEVFKGAIHIDSDSGFSRDKKDAIEGLITGTKVVDNFSNVPLLKKFYDPDVSLIQLSHNKSWDPRPLKDEFERRVDALKKRS